MSLFSVLNVGTKGLSASQLGMDITGQNITNADVKGYSRKRLNMEALYRKDQQFGQVGFGVEVVNIERLRSTFIDLQIQSQNQELGRYEELDNTMKTIENIFNEPGDTGIMSFIDTFFDSWQNLANNPADVSARTVVKTNGEILCESFRTISEELRKVKQSRNDEIESRVKKVNELSSEIFNLNKEIATVEISGQNANDSRDRRDQLLKELSKLIEITTIENSMGQVTVTTSGNIIVSPVDIQELEMTTQKYTRPDGTEYTGIGIRFKNSKRVYIPNGGQIKGLIESRDKYIPEYEGWLDELALGLAKNINEVHKSGFNLSGISGINFFKPETTGASDIGIAPAIVTDIKNIAAAKGGKQSPEITNTIDAALLYFGQSAVPLSKLGGAIPPLPTGNTVAQNIISGSLVVTIGGATLVEGTDYHIDYTNGTIQFLHTGFDANITPVSVKFRYLTANFPGPGDNGNAIDIAKMRNALTMQPDALKTPTATFDQFYSSIIGRLGFGRNEMESNLNTREFLVQQYESHQDSIAGVSLDEEMAELIKYQHTYQASARIITTANQMLETLLNL
jgi:flagellar hook-associated protein 1 FlgK